jgi:hypothetical protein
VRHEVCAAEHCGRVRAEEGQQFELLEGQGDLDAVGSDPALDLVDEQLGGGLRGQVRLALVRPLLGRARPWVGRAGPWVGRAGPWLRRPGRAEPWPGRCDGRHEPGLSLR